MQRHPTPARRSWTVFFSALASLVTALALVLGVGSPVAGGGWALGSLDSIPAASAEQTEQVGFMILQHGITPTHFADGVDGEVGIQIVRADGDVEFFEAVPDEKVGHFVATVTFPAAGDYTWNIQMGWFQPQDLGPLTVTADSSSSFDGGGAWSTARWGLLVVVGLLAAVAAGDLLAGRRRTAGAAS